MTFLDISAKETARQLTMLDFKMFQNIPIIEFEQQAWNTSEPTKTAPSLFNKISYFNEVWLHKRKF